jgi:NADPH:quinone reductase-like Zn-dependent oxidoreductase
VLIIPSSCCVALLCLRATGREHRTNEVQDERSDRPNLGRLDAHRQLTEVVRPGVAPLTEGDVVLIWGNSGGLGAQAIQPVVQAGGVRPRLSRRRARRVLP